MTNNVLNFVLRIASAAEARGIHKTLPLIIAPLVIGCNSAINQAIKSCDLGSKTACEEIANLDWARNQITKAEGKLMLEKVLNEIKYKKDIERAGKCITGEDSWCSDVNLKNLAIVDLVAAQNVSQRLAEVQVAKAKAERIKAEKASLGDWQYSTDEDMASGKKSSSASLQSENTLSFRFPYEGSQFAQLTLRRHPRYGLHAFISIGEGQILCNDYTNPYILVRFDDGEVRKFECAAPSDNSTTHSFIRNAAQFERALKKASVAYITLTFYQEGSQALKFKVKGYDSSKI